MTSLSRLDLPQVTLCCIDSTPRLPWSLRALQRCVDQICFGDAVLCADRASLGGRALPEGVRWVEIEPLRSIEAYSHFMLKSLAPIVRTSHVLIVQWDGYVLQAKAWDDEFLSCDYVGAPWHHVPEPHTVGNGGFSLRSRRLLLALEDPVIVPSHPEDICICRTYRARLEAQSLRFAPRTLAGRFAVEDEPLRDDVFGFHGPYHMPRLLPPDDVLAFIESLGTGAVAGHYFGSLLREMTQTARADARLQPAMQALQRLILQAVDGLQGPKSLTKASLGLCKALIRYGQYAAAHQLLAQRRAAHGSAWPDAKLRWRLNVNWLVSFLRSR